LYITTGATDLLKGKGKKCRIEENAPPIRRKYPDKEGGGTHDYPALATGFTGTPNDSLVT